MTLFAGPSLVLSMCITLFLPCENENQCDQIWYFWESVVTLPDLDLFARPRLQGDEMMNFGQAAGLARDLAVDQLDENHFDSCVSSTLEIS